MGYFISGMLLPRRVELQEALQLAIKSCPQEEAFSAMRTSLEVSQKLMPLFADVQDEAAEKRKEKKTKKLKNNLAVGDVVAVKVEQPPEKRARTPTPEPQPLQGPGELNYSDGAAVQSEEELMSFAKVVSNLWTLSFNGQ